MEEPATRNRPAPVSSRRPRDLVISLVLLVVPVLVLVGGYQVLAGRNQPIAIDPASQIVAARNAEVPVLEPAGLPEDWVPVTAAFRHEDLGPTLRLGYHTPDGAAVQLVQAAAPAASVVSNELVAGAEPAGVVDADGVTWQRYPAPPGERALVREDDGLTLVVVGPAAEAELVALAASLR